MNKKTWIFLGIIAAFVAILVIVYNATKTEDLISKVKVVEGIKFSKTKITKLNGRYLFYVTVTTSKKETLKVQEFEATIYDKKGDRIETLTGYIGDISSNSKKEITIEANEDLSKAYEVNYTVRFNND